LPMPGDETLVEQRVADLSLVAARKRRPSS
jgi:hypothetical protein